MKILFVHNQYKKRSGEEEALDNLSWLLRGAGHEVEWFTRSSSAIESSRLLKAKALFSGIHNPFAAEDLRKALTRSRPELVHVQNLFPLLSPAVLKVCKDEGIPVVMRCPNYRLTCPTGLHLSNGVVCQKCAGPGREINCVIRNCEDDLPKSLGYAARSAFARVTGAYRKYVDGFIVLSEFQKSRFIDAGIIEERIHIVPNVARIPSAEFDLPPIDGRITFIGRVSPEKGIDEFIEVARKLPNRDFSVAGGGDYLPVVRERAPANVRFFGHLDSKDLDNVFRESRIVLCPSKWFEGFPNVIAQAMARRRPVVSSRIGAIPEIVEHGKTGVLCEPYDIDALSRAVEFLMGNYDTCCDMGENARKQAEVRYSETAVYDALTNAYRATSAAALSAQ